VEEYPKIKTLFVRDEKTHKVIECEWKEPEFEYLQGNRWVWTEKVDGTNVRVGWDGERVQFAGRSDNAQMPTFLLARLQELFPIERLTEVFPVEDGIPPTVCLYGEGYGARIQKGGGNYIPDGVDFVLFDVKVGDWWLRRDDMIDVSIKLGIQCVPVFGIGTLGDAVKVVKDGINSAWGNFPAEGLVVRPTVDLMARNGKRVIGKIKTKDF
jgi:hypothetical protein